jgi:hypothetical protein
MLGRLGRFLATRPVEARPNGHPQRSLSLLLPSMAIPRRNALAFEYPPHMTRVGPKPVGNGGDRQAGRVQRGRLLHLLGRHAPVSNWDVVLPEQAEHTRLRDSVPRCDLAGWHAVLVIGKVASRRPRAQDAGTTCEYGSVRARLLTQIDRFGTIATESSRSHL